MVGSYDPQHGVRLVRNPHFREWSPIAQPSGFPDVIDERVGGSMDARVARVLTGKADLALDEDQAPSPALLQGLRTQHSALLEVNPWDITWELALNTRVSPFDDANARRAVNFALDRRRLTDLTLGQGVGQVSCQVLPPDFPGFRRYCPYTFTPDLGGTWTAPDLARARSLVRASGTRGRPVTVWVPAWFGIGKAAMNYLASVFESLGYPTSVRTYSNPVKTPSGQAIYSGWYADYAAPGGFIPPTLSCSGYNPIPAENTNLAGFCDPAIDRAIARAGALQTTDPQAASRQWAEVDREITREAPWVAFANGAIVEVKSPRVGNYQVNPQLGTLLDQLWVR